MYLLIYWCLMCVDTRVAECVEVRRHLAAALVGPGGSDLAASVYQLSHFASP